MGRRCCCHGICPTRPWMSGTVASIVPCRQNSATSLPSPDYQKSYQFGKPSRVSESTVASVLTGWLDKGRIRNKLHRRFHPLHLPQEPGRKAGVLPPASRRERQAAQRLVHRQDLPRGDFQGSDSTPAPSEQSDGQGDFTAIREIRQTFWQEDLGTRSTTAGRTPEYRRKGDSRGD
jgi:hypothetical protein